MVIFMLFEKKCLCIELFAFDLSPQCLIFFIKQILPIVFIKLNEKKIHKINVSWLNWALLSMYIFKIKTMCLITSGICRIQSFCKHTYTQKYNLSSSYLKVVSLLFLAFSSVQSNSQGLQHPKRYWKVSGSNLTWQLQK